MSSSPNVNNPKKREYNKPWLKNANTEDKINNEKQAKEKEREKNGFLYSLYPDGNGPDTELINGL